MISNFAMVLAAGRRPAAPPAGGRRRPPAGRRRLRGRPEAMVHCSGPSSTAWGQLPAAWGHRSAARGQRTAGMSQPSAKESAIRKGISHPQRSQPSTRVGLFVWPVVRRRVCMVVVVCSSTSQRDLLRPRERDCGVLRREPPPSAAPSCL